MNISPNIRLSPQCCISIIALLLARLIKYLWESYFVWFIFIKSSNHKHFDHEKSGTTVVKSGNMALCKGNYWNAKVKFLMQKDCYLLACFLSELGGARSNFCFNIKEAGSIHIFCCPLTCMIYGLSCLILFQVLFHIHSAACKVFASFELAYILA